MADLPLLICITALISCANAGSGGKVPVLKLNDRNVIPHLGLGTFLGFDEKGQKKPQDNEVSNAVEWAIESGYRLIDTASVYLNEDQVGKGIRNCIEKGLVQREDIFISTKLGMHDHRRVLDALRESLEKLDTDYVDLYLIHFPTAFTKDNKIDARDYLLTWEGMEEAKKLGLAKSIGLSNFNISQIQRILENSHVKPAVLQIEVNLNLAQNELVTYAQDEEIVVMAYSPFGLLFGNRELVKEGPPPRADDPVLVEIANKYNKTTPQIVLRHLIERGLVPIPKSTTKSRIEQNIDVFDFQLTQEDRSKLAKFNKNFRVVWPTFWQDHPYFPFEKTDKPADNPFG